MLTVLWLLAAVAATAIGFAAVGLVGSDLDPASQALAQPPLVQAPLPAATPSATPSPSGTAAPSPTASASIQRTRHTTGGVVTAACTGETVWLVSWSPNPGWAVDEIERGPGREAEARFENARGRVKVTVRCQGGVPAFAVEVPDSEGDDGGDDRQRGSGAYGSESGSSGSNSGSGDSERD
jgi:hypothetical protein